MLDTEYSIQLDPTITTRDGLATPDDFRSLNRAATDPEYTGKDVTIAMVDSGIDTSHPFFNDKDVKEGYDATGQGSPHTDAVGHNTWNITVPYHVFAPDATVIPVRVFGDNGRTSGKTLKKAYQWLYDNADRIDIATFALGSPNESKTLERWHSKLQTVGIRDVTSAGNSGQNAGAPATAQGAYTVGAVDENGKVTNFSSYEGPKGVPDVTMIGRNVLGAQTTDSKGIGRSVPKGRVPEELRNQYPDAQWMKASGTSVSGPAAAFAAAAWLEAQEHSNPLLAQKVYRQTARDSVDPGKQDADDGMGLVSHDAAMSRGKAQPDDDTVPGTVWSLPWGDDDFIQVDADVFEDGEYVFDKSDLKNAGTKQ